jgi:IS605 OrfB family transposase
MRGITKSAKDDTYDQMIDTVTCCQKVKISDAFNAHLDSLLDAASPCVNRMLLNREESSSKYYPEIPSAIAKSLIAKYQKNKKCRVVTHLILPICGDKGRQIKLVKGGIRIPAIFGKAVIPVLWSRKPEGFVRYAELYKREGEWYASIIYEVVPEPKYQPIGCLGVDMNAVGNVAVMSDPQNGHVRRLGYDPAKTKSVSKGRRKNLQIAKQYRLLSIIRRKQSRRTTHQNHIVSKTVVDYAAKHRLAVVVEDLGKVRKGKIKRFVEKSQWAYFQLLNFLRYKAALRGVPLLEVPAAYTSQECSRCGSINHPNGKQYNCSACGHNDHRDSNAGFNIAQRGWSAISTSILSAVGVGHIGGSLREAEVDYASA